MCHADSGKVSFEGISEQQMDLKVKGVSIPTFAYGYSSGDKKPAVIILHDIFGAGDFYRDLGKRLADQGFAAFLPDLFHREGPLPERNREAAMARGAKHSFVTALEELSVIVDNLSDEGRAVAVVGFCMGGTLGLLSATRFPGLKAAIIYYGFPVNAKPTPNRPNNPIEEVADLKAPLLGFFGEADAGVGPDNVRKYQEEARKNGKAVDFTIYPGIGHAFLTFDPQEASFEASQASWEQAISFLKKETLKKETAV
jgi:carboxymethylenebutenolidase